MVGLLFRYWKYKDKEIILSENIDSSTSTSLTFSNLGEVLSSSIMNAIHTIVMIGGFVVIFSVIISILNSSGLLALFINIFRPIFKSIGVNINYISPILSGLIELTNGLNQIVQVSTKSISITITLTAFLLGFGGVSILLQVLSITSKSDISIKPYILGKFLHGIIAAILTYTFIHIFPIFNLDLAPIFSQNVNSLTTMSAYTTPSNIIMLLLLIVITAFLIINKKAHNLYRQ